MLETYGIEELRSLSGLEVVDSEGRNVGYVDVVFRDDESGEPEWLGIWDGLPDGKPRVLVPIQGGEVVDGAVRLPWTEDVIKGAPSYEVEGDVVVGDDDAIEISQETERAAYDHYGIQPTAARPEGAEAVRFRIIRISEGAPQRPL